MHHSRIISETYVLSPKLKVTFTLVPGPFCSMTVDWEPKMPRRLQGKLDRQYVAARAQFYQKVANQMGRVALIDPKEGRPMVFERNH